MTLMNWLIVGLLLIISNSAMYVYAVRKGLKMALKELEELHKERKSNQIGSIKNRYGQFKHYSPRHTIDELSALNKNLEADLNERNN